MRNILLITRLEMRIFGSSPIMYVLGAVFLVISGYLFFDFLTSFSMVSLRAVNLDKMLEEQQISANIQVFVPLFSYMGFVLILILPLMTMRLLAEEKKSGTIELLMTYPIRDIEIVSGKLLACACVLGLLLGATLLYPALTSFFGVLRFGPILSGYLGLFLQGQAFVALGLFASSLTENQIIAAILTYGGVIIFAAIRFSISYVPKLTGKILEYLSVSTHSSALIQGVVDTRDVVYYLIFFAFFSWLTLKSLETKRKQKQ